MHGVWPREIESTQLDFVYFYFVLFVDFSLLASLPMFAVFFTMTDFCVRAEFHFDFIVCIRRWVRLLLFKRRTTHVANWEKKHKFRAKEEGEKKQQMSTTKSGCFLVIIHAILILNIYSEISKRWRYFFLSFQSVFISEINFIVLIGAHNSHLIFFSFYSLIICLFAHNNS